jgi:hypothetical protein
MMFPRVTAGSGKLSVLRGFHLNSPRRSAKIDSTRSNINLTRLLLSCTSDFHIDRMSHQGKPMSNEIDSKIRKAQEALKGFGYSAVDVSAREFYDYMTGEIFSDDPTTLRDVLGNEYIMIHELVEIGELKKTGRKIDKRVIVGTPKIPFYTAHLNAMETELKYALSKGDTYWMRMRLKMHKDSVLDDDPNLPEELRPKAEEIYEKYRRLAKQVSEQPVTL